MPMLPGSYLDDPAAMASYWYPLNRATNMVRTENPVQLSKGGDPAQTDADTPSGDKIEMNNFATTDQGKRRKLTRSNPHPDGSAQKELIHQGLKDLARPPRKHYRKPKAPQKKPMQTMEPSPSAPRRAPTAQMLPRSSNAEVTPSPATAIMGTSATRLISPDSISINMESQQVLLPATASSSLPTPSILPSTPPVLPEQSTSKKRVSTQKPKISLTPAPATAPSAFEDPSLAAHVQNTKFLSPVKQRTNGVKKRQQILSSSSPKPASTPESVPAEKRGRGHPRTQVEEQPHEGKRPYRRSTMPKTPTRRRLPPDQYKSSVAGPSNRPRQQHQAATLNMNSESTPTLCSEEPRLWPGRGDHVASLLHFDKKPVTIHSEPIQVCANHAAHQDSREPHGHGVCTTCLQSARRHLRVTRPELFSPAWWPLCKTCGDHELLHSDPKREGCSCSRTWLCFPCYTYEIERRSMRNSVEAEFRRRTIIGAGTDRGVETVWMGWMCECGREIGPDATLMTCIGCDGIRVEKLDPGEIMAREKALTKNAFAWT